MDGFSSDNQRHLLGTKGTSPWPPYPAPRLLLYHWSLHDSGSPQRCLQRLLGFLRTSPRPRGRSLISWLGWALFPQCSGHMLGFPGGSVVKKKKKKNYLPMQRLRFDPWVGKIPWRKERLPSILARTVPWREEPGGLQFMRSHSQIQQSTLSLATR